MIAGMRSLRSLSGFRLICSRPLLSVALLPSTPTNDVSLHRRIFEDLRRDLLLALGHIAERDALRRLQRALNDAVVLHREETFRDQQVQQYRQRRVPTATPSVSRG